MFYLVTATNSCVNCERTWEEKVRGAFVGGIWFGQIQPRNNAFERSYGIMVITTHGNVALWKRVKIGFLASRRVPPEAVMRCLDWATRMRDEGVCVMSGFQSPLEKEVLNILLKGTSPLILVLARRMWDERHIPALFRKPLAEGRLLVVSPVSQTIRRVDARSAAQRNRYILDHADSLFLGALDPDGSLTDLLPLPSHL